MTPDKGMTPRGSFSPTKLVFPVGSPTLADGITPRKRSYPSSQEEAISLEYQRRESGGTLDLDPIDLLCDKGCFTLLDYWTTYQKKWKPKEAATGGAWRKDFAYDNNGKLKNQRKQWWTQRSCIFEVVECYMEEGLTEELALAKADKIFNSVPCQPGKHKRPIKLLNKAFKKEMGLLGIKKSGRPRKKNKRHSVDGDGDAFSQAFPMNASQQLHYEQVQLECQHNEWANHNQETAVVPPTLLHPFPFRPVAGQPPTQLPPGHQHAAL